MSYQRRDENDLSSPQRYNNPLVVMIVLTGGIGTCIICHEFVEMFYCIARQNGSPSLTVLIFFSMEGNVNE
jgi:hypothetical protein